MGLSPQTLAMANKYTDDKNKKIDAQLADIVTNIECENNIKSIKNFLNKLKMKQPVTIVRMGDSLVDGAGSTPYWFDLLWNETYRESEYSLLKEYDLPVGCVTDIEYASGGTTLDLMLSHIVPQMTLNGHSSGTWSLQASESLYTTPPLFKQKVDLVIFDGGQNGGIYNNVIIEEMARRLIENGIDVLMISTHRNKNAINPPEFKQYYNNIASHYGCALIDFDELYMENWEYANNNYYADTTHQSVLGHEFWALALKKLLNIKNANKQLTPFEKILPKSRLYWLDNANKDFQNSYSIQFCNLPISTNGAIENAVTGSGIKSPVISQGLSKHVKLDAGQEVIFNFDDAIYFIPIWGGRNLDSMVEYYVNDSSNASISRNVNIGYATCKTDFNIPYSIYASLNRNASTVKRLKLKVTTGGLYLLGVLVFSEPCKIYRKTNVEDYPTSIIFSGTWNDSATNYQQTTEKYKYTNADGDNIKFKTTCKKIGLSLLSGKYGGIIDVYDKGIKINSIDTYVNQGSTGSYTYQIDLGSYELHDVELRLNGKNPNASSEITMPRFALRKIYTYEDKYNLTEKQFNDIKQKINAVI